MKNIQVFLLALLTGFQAHAVSLQLSDPSIGWNEEKFIGLTASNLTPGAEVTLALYADLNTNSTIDASDPLVWGYKVTDGNTNNVLDEFAIGDRDGAANGTLEARISYHGMYEGILHTVGQYIWLAASGAENDTALFTVNEPTNTTVVISGQVLDMVTSNAPSAAIVLLEPFNDSDGPAMMVWTRPDGTFEITSPFDAENLAGAGTIAAGCLSAEYGPNDEAFSWHEFTAACSAGTNTLDRPLYVASTVTNDLATIVSVSGQVFYTDGTTTNVLPGALVMLESDSYDDDDEFESFCISDTNGYYRLSCPVTAVPVELWVGGYDLNIRQLVGTGTDFESVGNDIVTNLICRTAEHLVSGYVTNAIDGGIGGIDVFLENDDLVAFSIAATDTDGYFELCSLGGTNWYAGIEEDSLEAAGYLKIEDIPDIAIPSEQNIELLKGFLISGTVYDSATNSLSDGGVYGGTQTYWADADVNFSGEYSLRLPEGTNNIGMWGFEGYLKAQQQNIVGTEGGSTNLDFYLERGAIISGTVTAGGNPFSECTVFADTDSYDEMVWPEDDGTYAITVPPDTDVILSVNPHDWNAYLQQFYSNAFSYAGATTLNVSTNEPLTGIDFDLYERCTVNGQVIDHFSSAGLTAEIRAYSADDESELTQTWCDGNGNFSLGIPADCAVVIKAENHFNYAAEYWQDSYAFDLADAIELTGGASTNVTFRLYEISADSDGDGVKDHEEDTVPDGIYTAGQDIADKDNGDTDDDGQSDYQEIVIAGTSPSNPDSLFEVAGATATAEGNVLNWSPVSGKQYAVDYSTNLANGFLPLASGITGGSYTDTVYSAESKVYYRISVQP